MKALKHLLTTTAAVPLAEGNKVHACNFADTQMLLTILIFVVANMEDLCSTGCDLLVGRPEMPPQRHAVAAHSPRVAKEGHWASNGSVVAAGFVVSILMPLGAQGRGSACQAPRPS